MLIGAFEIKRIEKEIDRLESKKKFMNDVEKQKLDKKIHKLKKLRKDMMFLA